MIEKSVLDQWKKTFKGLFVVEVSVTNEDKAIGYYKTPSAMIINVCLDQLNTFGLSSAMEFLANNTWLGGDYRQQVNDSVALAAQAELWKLMANKHNLNELL